MNTSLGIYNEYRHGSISPSPPQNQESWNCFLVDLKKIRRAWSSTNYENNGEVAPLPAPGPAPPAPTFTTFNSHKDGSDQGSDDTSTHGVESAQGAMPSSLPEEKNTPNRWFKCLSGKELKTHWCEDVCVDLVESITIGVFVMCGFFFFPTACLPWKKIGLEVWGRWDFRMEISHHPGLCQASLDKYNKPHPPVWTAIYGELLIKRKEDSQWVRRADHRPPLIKHRCNLLFLRFLQSENQETAKGAKYRPKDKNSGTVHEWGFFSRKPTMQQLGKHSA